MESNMQLRDGTVISNPTLDRLKGALSQLDNPEDTGYDLFLTANINDADWFVTALSDNSVTLTILGDGHNSPLYTIYDLQSVPRGEVIELWLELQNGQTDKIMARPWNLHPQPTDSPAS